MADRVMIMAQNPGQIVSELKVDLPWPRRHMDHKFQQLREQLMNMFTDTKNKDNEKTKPLGKQTVAA